MYVNDNVCDNFLALLAPRILDAKPIIGNIKPTGIAKE
jgi:hypothetical protein